MIESKRISRRKLIGMSGAVASGYMITSCSSDNNNGGNAEDIAPSRVDPTTWEANDLEALIDSELLMQYRDLPVTFDIIERIAGVQFPLGSPPSIPGMTIETVDVVSDDGYPVPVRVYRPDALDEDAPAVYSIHGGGMITGSIAQDENRNIDLAKQLNVLVVAPEYRLAPGNPYPLPLNDCYAGLNWLFNSAGELGVDPTRIAIAGQSAGAGLAAGVVLLDRDQNGPRICYQHLIYPMIDDRNQSRSSYNNADSKTWSRDANLFGWSAYLGELSGTDGIPYYAAPSRAADLSNLPPTYIAVGTLDVFMDEDIDYARALNVAGVAIELHVYPGVFHGFDILMPETMAAQRWYADELVALRKGIR